MRMSILCGHTLKRMVTSDRCCFKLDMKNVFNKCHRSSFLKRLDKEFPELVGWV